MTTYSKNRTPSKIYRKIYEDYYGPIPIDADGKSYEIHHIDGNHKNNDPSNLIAVSAQEHYDIHYSQGDWGACWLMAERLKLSSKEISELARLAANRRVENGTHNFQDSEFQREKALRMVREGTNVFVGGEIQRQHNRRRVNDGSHHLLKRPDGTSHSSDRVNAGTHNFQDSKSQQERALKRVKNKTHNFQKREGYEHPSTSEKWYCHTCKKEGKNAGSRGRYHKGHEVTIIN